MTSSLQQTDNEAKAVQKTPNRVALADIEAAISSERTFIASAAVHALQLPPPDASLDVLTITIITMKNGFTVIGKSAPADAGNFDAAAGAKFAREDAIRQLWPLMGFALRDRLHTAQA